MLSREEGSLNLQQMPVTSYSWKPKIALNSSESSNYQLGHVALKRHGLWNVGKVT